MSAICVAAQGEPVLSTNPPPPAPKREIIKVLGSAQVSYDAKKDESVASSGRIKLKVGDSGWGSLNSSFNFKGKSIQRPEGIMFGIFLAANDRTFVDNRRFAILVNGEKLLEGSAELRDGRTNGREIYSTLGISVSLENFIAITKAKKLQIQLAQVVWDIPTSDLSGFEDLLTIIEEAS